MFEDIISFIKKFRLILIGGAVVLFLISILASNFISKNSKQSRVDDLVEQVQQNNQTLPKNSSESDNDSLVYIDVKGSVKNEGVYQLKSGQRVNDAVGKAGGFTEEADKTSVNLSQKLKDEMVVYVANKDENRSLIPSDVVQNNVSSEQNKEASININTASLEELQKISGIGQKKAQDIMNYREEHSGFKTVDDLKNVSGIGEKTLEKIKSEVSVD